MSSTWGKNIRISVFGESHGAGIGVVIDGLPAGQRIDMQEIAFQMELRAPGRNAASTARRESDQPEIVSGVTQNSTNGAPLCAIIRNVDSHSSDYDTLKTTPRPGHADYTGAVRYNGCNDARGGGHFSGRLTAPMVFAGAVCRQILSRNGIEIGAHIRSIADITDAAFDPVKLDAATLRNPSLKPFPVCDESQGQKMLAAIEEARQNGDSVGGIVECAAIGLPTGLGDPIFDGVENRLASLIFGIPAVKGIEFGSGFGAASLRGSENNDAFTYQDGTVKTVTNRHGGILGGITSGMPVVFRVAFKPTPSIYREQQTIDIEKRCDTVLRIQGRHDPCIVQRAVPVVENLTAVCLLDLVVEDKCNDFGRNPQRD